MKQAESGPSPPPPFQVGEKWYFCLGARVKRKGRASISDTEAAEKVWALGRAGAKAHTKTGVV